MVDNVGVEWWKRRKVERGKGKGEIDECDLLFINLYRAIFMYENNYKCVAYVSCNKCKWWW